MKKINSIPIKTST